MKDLIAILINIVGMACGLYAIGWVVSSYYRNGNMQEILTNPRSVIRLVGIMLIMLLGIVVLFKYF